MSMRWNLSVILWTDFIIHFMIIVSIFASKIRIQRKIWALFGETLGEILASLEFIWSDIRCSVFVFEFTVPYKFGLIHLKLKVFTQ